MRKSVTELKQEAKNMLAGNWGNAIVAAVIPGFVIGIFNAILNQAPVNQIYILVIVTSFTTAFASFMSINMVTKMARGKRDSGIGESLTPADRLVKYLLYSIITMIIGLAITIPGNLIVFDEVFVTQTGIESTLLNSGDDIGVLYGTLYQYLGYLVATSLLVSFLLVPFFFVDYFIIDEGLGVIEAIGKSFRYTKGNFFRTILVQLSFFGWNILVSLTCGLLIFYVGPYMSMTYNRYYLAVKEESGEPIIWLNKQVDMPSQTEWYQEEKTEEKVEDQNKSDWDF